nr:respiratory nitrate reductase subunit gamma [Escherichia coli]
MIQYLNVFFYDIYPYLCGTVFILGSWLRYDYGQYTWRAASSQMLDKRGMVLWSNLFHIGILGIFFGHLFGMLTPHWMYAWFLPVAVNDAPRDKCTLSCAINGIHAAFHYLKKNYISGCVMTVPTGW